MLLPERSTPELAYLQAKFAALTSYAISAQLLAEVLPLGRRLDPTRPETISSSFVESAVNQVISKRMVKKQQMRWTPRGAHLLLQIRTRVLNDELATDFHRWYPGFAHTADRQALAA